jgi:oligoribonuclease
MKHFVWLDMEMTGLDPIQDQVLEIAVKITDSELNIVDEFELITIGHKISELNFNFGDKEEELLDAFKTSGLLDRVQGSEITVKEAEEILLTNIVKHCERKKCHLAGSSIWTDARFLIHQMPKVWDFVHYKLLDVTSLKILKQEWYPEVDEFKKADTHDALTDIKESIE